MFPLQLRSILGQSYNSATHAACKMVLVIIGILVHVLTGKYAEELDHEYNCIHDLCHQLYLVPPLHFLAWVKYYNPPIDMPLPNKEF